MAREKHKRYRCMFCNKVRVTHWQGPIKDGIVACWQCEKAIGDQLMAAHRQEMDEWYANLRRKD